MTGLFVDKKEIDMAKLTITASDLAYARGQAGLVMKSVFGDRPWEACLLVQEARMADGQSLGDCILDRLVAIKQREMDSGVHRTVRNILTWVFAPVFRGAHFALPPMNQADLDTMNQAYTSDPPEISFNDLMEDVRSGMSRLNGTWAKVFFENLEKYQSIIAMEDRRFILVCTRLLLAKVWVQEQHEKLADAPKEQENKTSGNESNADRWAKLLGRELEPVMHTGVIFSDVGGCYQAKRRMMELSHLLSQPNAVARWGVQVPRGVLLYGPPGTGKTLLVKALASHTSRALFQIKMSNIFSLWYGQSLEYLSKIFAQAKKAQGAILFFDEADGVISSRHSRSSHEESSRVVTQFNMEMEEITPEDMLTVILATNIKEHLDEAAIRDQRIDLVIPFTLPDMAERQEILFVHRAAAITRASRSVFSEDVDLAALAAISEGLSGAALAHVIERALWEKALHDVRDGIDEDQVTQADLVRSIRERLAERKDAEHHIGFSAPKTAEEINLDPEESETDFLELLGEPSTE